MIHSKMIGCLILGTAMLPVALGAAQQAGGELAVPRTAAVRKVPPTATPAGRRALPKLDQPKATALFSQAARALNLPVVQPNLNGAFLLCPRQPEVPGRGFILSIVGAKLVMPADENGTARFLQAGDEHHFVQIGFTAMKGLYLVRTDATGGGGSYSADIQVSGQYLTVSGMTDAAGMFTFPIYAPTAGKIYITFKSPIQQWLWNGCEIIPQQ